MGGGGSDGERSVIEQSWRGLPSALCPPTSSTISLWWLMWPHRTPFFRTRCRSSNTKVLLGTLHVDTRRRDSSITPTSLANTSPILCAYIIEIN